MNHTKTNIDIAYFSATNHAELNIIRIVHSYFNTLFRFNLIYEKIDDCIYESIYEIEWNWENET